MLWPAYEANLAKDNGKWETIVRLLYSPPAEEVGDDGRQLPEPPPEPPQAPQGPQGPPGPASDPQLLLGKALRKKFGRKYFTGTIAKYHKTTGYRVEYEDGDEEDLSAEDAQALVVPGP